MGRPECLARRRACSARCERPARPAAGRRSRWRPCRRTRGRRPRTVPAMSRWAQVASSTNSSRNEAGVDRAGLALRGGVGQVGDGALASAPCTRGGGAGARASSPVMLAGGASIASAQLVVVGDQRPRRSSRARRRRRRSASPGRRSARRPGAAHQVSASARISRPSASVLLTSTVLPLSWVMMSPGLHRACPLGMFSTDGTTVTQVDREAELGDRRRRLEHRGAARHVHLHLAASAPRA